MSAIKTSIVTVTPVMANAMLCHNTGNRTVREPNVQKYIKLLTNKEWKLTHQGIAFDVNGKLIDGQHRLMAIVRSGISAEMMVTHGLPTDSEQGMDQGARRSAADLLHETPKIAELINLAARLLTGESSPTPATLQKIRPAILPFGEKIMAEYGGNTTFFASAPMKLAAVARMIFDKDEGYILKTYGDLCRSNLDYLPPIGHALVKAHLKGRTNTTNKQETMAAGLYVFDQRNKDYKQLRLDVPNAADTVRAALRIICPV